LRLGQASRALYGVLPTTIPWLKSPAHWPWLV